MLEVFFANVPEILISIWLHWLLCVLFTFSQNFDLSRTSWHHGTLSQTLIIHIKLMPLWFCLLKIAVQFSSVQFSCSVVSDSVTPWIAARQTSLSITNSWSSLRLTSIKSVMPSSHLILCCPLFLLPPIPPSIRVFSNESTLHMRWPKYWSFSLASFLPKNTQDWSPLEWTGWISLQSKGLSRVFSNTTVQKHQFWLSAFFTVQLSHPYMTTGKTIALLAKFAVVFS